MKLQVTSSVLLLFTIAIASPAWANNNLFLPGDAYFPTVLTKPDIESLLAKKTGQRQFVYSSFDGYAGAFCGYAGYLNASIPAVDDEFAANLKIVYQKIRQHEGRKLQEQTVDGKTSLIETNGVRVLFYPPEFDFRANKLGLRYNENWVAETMKFGHTKKHIRLCSLVADPDAVETCWRDAEDVPELPAETPHVKLKPVPATESPVVIPGPVQAIVIGSHSLIELFEEKQEAYFTIYVVSANGIQKIVHQDGEWKPEEFNE